MTEPAASAPIDKLAPFRHLFGMPVAVQFAGVAPYIQIAPMTDQGGRPQTARHPVSGELIGMPAVAEPAQPTAVAVGVLSASADGTWLVIEQQIRIARTGETPEGRAFMDVLVRPEMVTHVSFVRSVEFNRRPEPSADH